MNWLVLLIAACSMGKDPEKQAVRVAPPPPPMGTLRGHTMVAMHGPGRAHGPEESFTSTSAVPFLVRSGSAAVHSGSDGSYALELTLGHHEVTFEDGSKNCCSDPKRTFDVDIVAGSNTLDFTCDCHAH